MIPEYEKTDSIISDNDLLVSWKHYQRQVINEWITFGHMMGRSKDDFLWTTIFIDDIAIIPKQYHKSPKTTTDIIISHINRFTDRFRGIVKEEMLRSFGDSITIDWVGCFELCYDKKSPDDHRNIQFHIHMLIYVKGNAFYDANMFIDAIRKVYSGKRQVLAKTLCNGIYKNQSFLSAIKSCASYAAKLQIAYGTLNDTGDTTFLYTSGNNVMLDVYEEPYLSIITNIYRKLLDKSARNNITQQTPLRFDNVNNLPHFGTHMFKIIQSYNVAQSMIAENTNARVPLTYLNDMGYPFRKKDLDKIRLFCPDLADEIIAYRNRPNKQVGGVGRNPAPLSDWNRICIE